MVTVSYDHCKICFDNGRFAHGADLDGAISDDAVLKGDMHQVHDWASFIQSSYRKMGQKAPLLEIVVYDSKDKELHRRIYSNRC
jgi:hypothetical protein